MAYRRHSAQDKVPKYVSGVKNMREREGINLELV